MVCQGDEETKIKIDCPEKSLKDQKSKMDWKKDSENSIHLSEIVCQYKSSLAQPSLPTPKAFKEVGLIIHGAWWDELGDAVLLHMILCFRP